MEGSRAKSIIQAIGEPGHALVGLSHILEVLDTLSFLIEGGTFGAECRGKFMSLQTARQIHREEPAAIVSALPAENQNDTTMGAIGASAGASKP